MATQKFTKGTRFYIGNIMYQSEGQKLSRLCGECVRIVKVSKIYPNGILAYEGFYFYNELTEWLKSGFVRMAN